MTDQIPEEEKNRRLAVLQDKQREIQTKRNEALVGQTFEVLVSGKSRKENQWTGYTSSHRVLNFTSTERELLGRYVTTLVTGSSPNCLTGEQIATANYSLRADAGVVIEGNRDGLL